MKVQHIGPKLAAIGAFVALCLGIFVFLLKTAGVELLSGHRYTLNARLPDGLQLVNNGDVRASGVKVGRIAKITNVGDQAQVKLQLEGKALPVYRDARVQVRTKTLVGENYIDLDRGTPAAGKLPDGSQLPVTRAEEAVQLDQILSTLDPKTRDHVKATIRSLAGGFDGRGRDVNTVLGTLEPTFGDGGKVVAALDQQRQDLGAVVDEAGQVMQAFGERTQAVRTLAIKLRQTAVAAGSRDQALRQMLRELPPTLNQTRTSVTKLAGLSRQATPVVNDLTAATRQLTPAVRDLAPAARDARALVTQLDRLLPSSGPLLRDLVRFADRTQPLAPALAALLREINPALAYLAPYNREFGAFFANVGSVVDTHDALGNLGRVHAVVSETSLATYTPAMQKAINALIDAGGVEKLHREYINTYPKPGTVGDPQPGDGSYTRVQAASR